MTVKLHVGYIGKTRAGERVEIVGERPSTEYPWMGDNGETFVDGGRVYLTDTQRGDIIGPWQDEPAVGQWVGWNGGECPVHPDTVVEVVFIEEADGGRADGFYWHHDGDDYDIIAYRIITPYVEPKKAREWFAVVTDRGAIVAHPDEDMAELYRSGMRRGGNEVIHVREVLDDEPADIDGDKPYLFL